ncbi:MAG: DUF1724 domain-containing protein [Candidatus Bathyarchaeota archaeon]|nr:DUF1724 domain-containing protein [Candidatus Bathyarchaeota archaeon]
MEGSKGIDRLFYELASESRFGILMELQVKDLKMRQIARSLDLTDTETFRQMQRLSEARLVQKQPDGTYRLTAYAKLVLNITSPLDFISKFREYFLDHDAMLLPCEFRARLGELSKCELITATVETINKVTEFVKGAQRRIDSVILGFEAITEVMRQRSQEGVKVRWLIEDNSISRVTTILRSWQQLPEIRSIPTVAGHYTVTDKAAMLILRYNDGTWSYVSFIGEDASFLKWTEELFMYEWQKAKPWHP